MKGEGVLLVGRPSAFQKACHRPGSLFLMQLRSPFTSIWACQEVALTF
jgi:hypothetical protein